MAENNEAKEKIKFVTSGSSDEDERLKFKIQKFKIKPIKKAKGFQRNSSFKSQMNASFGHLTTKD